MQITIDILHNIKLLLQTGLLFDSYTALNRNSFGFIERCTNCRWENVCLYSEENIYVPVKWVSESLAKFLVSVSIIFGNVFGRKTRTSLNSASVYLKCPNCSSEFKDQQFPTAWRLLVLPTFHRRERCQSSINNSSIFIP